MTKITGGGRTGAPLLDVRSHPTASQATSLTRLLTSPMIAPQAGQPTVTAGAGAYRLYDVGYSISLDQALNLLASKVAERMRPIRGEAAALQIANPPVAVVLGNERLSVNGRPYNGEVVGRIFDFGVVSLHLRVEAAAQNDMGRVCGLG